MSSALLALLTSFAGGSAVAGKGVTGATLNSNTPTTTPLTSLVNGNPNPTGNVPKAGVNWILFDEQFRPVANGYDAVNTAGDYVKTHSMTASIIQNGYLYVYCSDESNVDVYFDNLQVVHNRGPLEETHYYPFGLTMAGISSSAAGSLENRKKYNGIEYDSAFGIDEYEAYYRDLDPQTGRWWQIDPKCEPNEDPDEPGLESLSPYNAMANDPARNSDPLGDEPCCALTAEYWEAVKNTADAQPEVEPEVYLLGAGGLLVVGTADLVMTSPGSVSAGAMDHMGPAPSAFVPDKPVSKPPLSMEQTKELANEIKQGVTNLGNKIAKGFRLLTQGSTANTKPSKVEKSTKVEQIGSYTKKTKVEPSKKSPGQSRAEYVTYKNRDGKTVRTYKDSYDRGNKFQGRKPLRGGPEGRPSQ